MKIILFISSIYMSLIYFTNKLESILFFQNKVVDTYFGKDYTDPFRYIENLKDSIVIDILHKQDDITEQYLSNITNYHKILKKQDNLKSANVKITQLQVTKNKEYFYVKQGDSKSKPVLCMRKGFEGKEEILYDSKNFKSQNDANYLINYIQPSWDGKKVVISLTKNDEEISDLIILDVNKRKVLPQIITNATPSSLGGVSWLPDNSGFIYCYFQDIDKNSLSFLHNGSAVLYLLNEDPEKRRVLLSKENNPDLNILETDFPIVFCRSENSQYLFGRIAGGRYFDDYYYAKITDNFSDIQWKPLCKKEDKVNAGYFDGENIYFRTTQNAPNYKLCKTSIKNPNFKNPEVLIEEDSASVLSSFVVTSNGIFVVRIKNGVEANLFQYTNNNLNKISLPKELGNIILSSISHEYEDLWIETKGWTSNQNRYYYRSESSGFVKENLYPVTELEEMKDCIVEEIEIKTHDGEMVPLSVIYKKGTKLNGKAPLFIGGYGAFGYIFSPSLRSHLYQWVTEGGVFAVAHVRGGGEKGDKWYREGYRATKANTWKDFNACTEYLIENKYANPAKVVAWSASAGGVMVGMAVMEKPALYKAAIIENGVMNPMRIEFGINAQAGQEYGSVKDSVAIEYLYQMDSYHHIQEGVKYPAFYLTAGINDTRLPAWQPAKFAAKMQMVNADNNITLLSVDFEGGHGFDASQDKFNRGIANTIAFAFWQTGHPDFQLK